jgi:hypothetical protein
MGWAIFWLILSVLALFGVVWRLLVYKKLGRKFHFNDIMFWLLVLGALYILTDSILYLARS